jgi:MFS family permease
MMAASFIVPAFLKKYRLKNAIFWGLFVFGASQVIMILAVFTALKVYFDNWHLTYLMFCLSIAMGVAVTFFNIPIGIIFQRNTSDEYRGRFWGFYSSITSFTIPVAYLLGGFLAQQLPLVVIFVSSTILLFLLDIWAVNVKEVRELKEQ